MISRRSFLATTAAGLAAPSIVSAFELDPIFMPQEVRVGPAYAPGQLLILPKAHFLYFITEPRKALRYGVGVGKAGLEFTGTAVIQVKKEWPTWRPTDEMIEREPKTYAKFIDNDYVQPGGPGNPLGARALYLFPERARHLFPHPRHHRAAVDWPVGLQRLHPDDQRTCHRPLQPRAQGHRGHRSLT